MIGRPAAEGAVLAALLAVFLCRAALASAIVPPWQGPDEPTHLALTYGLTMPTVMHQRMEADVLQSMVRQGFWALYEDPPPDPLPPLLSHVLGIGPGTLTQPLYYVLGAVVLRISRPSDVESAYRHLRYFSIVLAVLALAFGWAGSRLLFGSEVAAGAATIAVLHPQFLLTAISVNSDALLNVCGGFVWWQAARVMTGRRRAFSIALMLTGAAAAILTKRLGGVLLVIAVAVAVAPLAGNRRWRPAWRDLALIAAVAGAGLVVLAAARTFFAAEFGSLAGFWSNALIIRRPLDSTMVPEMFRFLRMTVDYFWLIAGWLRFQPPGWWLWIARVLIVGGMAGAVVALVSSDTDRRSMATAWLFVAAQVMAMLFVVFWTIPSAPQARYLFPVFAPITVLLYVGLRRWIPRAFRPQWAVALVVLLVALDVTGFTTVHIPTYLR
jgi:hypothetical protein